MHKNIPVADLALDTASGVIISIGAVYEAAHAPVGVPAREGSMDRGSLNEWWRGPILDPPRRFVSFMGKCQLF